MIKYIDVILYLRATYSQESRAYEHKEKLIDGFVKKYSIMKLVSRELQRILIEAQTITIGSALHKYT
jgi:predicted GIY-YIG superfamily endonuclease